MASKTYRAIKEKAPTDSVDLATAVAFLKDHARTSFDETVELHIRLGIDAEKSDQTVRGTVQLPAGTPKQLNILVFTDDPALQKAALAAGATTAGGEELIKQIAESGSVDADLTVATPSMMPKVAQAAKILGPKGLMPNPKTGTVSDDPADVVKQLQSGKASFRMDQAGNIHQAVAKLSWDADQITANTQALLAAITAARPASAKGEFLKRVTLTSTMGVGVKINA